jgi:uncharacterized membrane protein (TIGR02234 family)
LAAVGAGLVAAVWTARAGGPAGDGTAWPWVAAAGGLVVLAAGALTAARGRRWRAMSGRYEAPSGRNGTAGGSPRRVVDPHVAQWEALDRGDDPTG